MKKYFLFLIIILGLSFADGASADVFNYFTNGLDRTPSVKGAWTDVDVSADIPAGATGVILEIRNASTTVVAFGLRKNGSTDNLIAPMANANHFGAAVGVDGNRIFEVYDNATQTLKVFLLGYTTAGATFLTNSVQYTITGSGNWYNIDASNTAPGAVGLIFDFNDTTSGSFGVRKYGSTDARIYARNTTHLWIFIGCDTSQKSQAWVEYELSVGAFFLTGYITSGATFLTNAIDISIATTGAYYDLPALPTGANGGFIEVVADTYRYYHLRMNGSSDDRYTYYVNRINWFNVGAANQIIEARIENAGVDFWLVGYTTHYQPRPGGINPSGGGFLQF